MTLAVEEANSKLVSHNSLRGITSPIHPSIHSNILLRSRTAHSDNVLTFSNNIYIGIHANVFAVKGLNALVQGEVTFCSAAVYFVLTWRSLSIGYQILSQSFIWRGENPKF